MGARYVWVAAWRKLSSSRKLVRLVPFAVVDKIEYIVRVRKFIQFIERSANKIVKLIPTTAFVRTGELGPKLNGLKYFDIVKLLGSLIASDCKNN